MKLNEKNSPWKIGRS